MSTQTSVQPGKQVGRKPPLPPQWFVVKPHGALRREAQPALEINRRSNRMPRRRKRRKRLISPRLDQPAVGCFRRSPDDTREPGSQVACGLIAVAPRIRRIAAHIRDHERPQMSFLLALSRHDIPVYAANN